MAKAIPRITLALTDGSDAAVESDPISPNQGVYQGTICLLKLVVPNVANPITVTIGIYDENDFEKYSISGLAENDSHPIPVSVPIVEKEYVKMTPSGDPGTTADVTLDMEYTPDKP